MKKMILNLILLCTSTLSFSQNTPLFENSTLTFTQLSEDQKELFYSIGSTYKALSATFITVSNVKTVQEGGILAFGLPSGEQLTAQVFRVYQGEENTFVWTGKIGENGDFISLARNEGGTGGMIKYQDRFYSIHPLDSDNSLFIESDLSVHEDLVCGNINQIEAGISASDECGPNTCNNPLIDILVVWTDEAVAWLNGLGNPFIIAIYTSLGMESVNIAFANSGIESEVRYSSTRYSDFNFSTSVDVLLDLVELTNDSTLNSLRNSFSADLVIMMTNQGYLISGSPVFGAINAIGPNQNAAFSLIEISSLISPRWTLAHEVAHFFGARHNRSYNVPCPPSSPNCGDDTDICAHAWRFDGMSGNENRTILASLGVSGERILHYSNPDVSFDGSSTGTDDSNNAGHIENSACLISDFFPPRY